MRSILLAYEAIDTVALNALQGTTAVQRESTGAAFLSPLCIPGKS